MSISEARRMSSPSWQDWPKCCTPPHFPVRYCFFWWIPVNMTCHTPFPTCLNCVTVYVTPHIKCNMGIILHHFSHTFQHTAMSWHHLLLPFLVIYDMGIIGKHFLSTFSWQWWHLLPLPLLVFVQYGYHWKAFFEYFLMAMMASSPIAFFGNNTYDYCLKAFF